jgi:hypothetical protein
VTGSTKQEAASVGDHFPRLAGFPLALDALEKIDGPLPILSAFTAALGGCEFCPMDGGGCCVCGKWN